MACPAPFLLESDYPTTGGYIGGRLCGNLSLEVTCCLPCDKQSWVYTNGFNRDFRIAYWLNVPSLVCQVFLLLTFCVLPQALSHRHYLSVSLCLALIMLELGFIIPLGTKPSMCFNDITPKDQYSSVLCAWSGALFIAGSSTAAVWILLRSVWIHLQLCWGFSQITRLFWPVQIIGWGIPAILIAVSIPVTGVSYRLGTTCLPNADYAFETYLGWLMAFGCLALILQLATTIYCAWIYLRDAIRGGSRWNDPSHTSHTSAGTAARTSDMPTLQKMTWCRMKNVIKSQWRSILLCVLNIVNSVYYGSIFAAQTKKNKAIFAGTSDTHILEWAGCISLSGGDPEKCRGIPNIINEKAFEVSFIMAGLIGIATFLLMFRSSMLTGWGQLFTRHFRCCHSDLDDEDFLPIESQQYPKRRSFGRPLESEKLHGTPTAATATTTYAAPVSPVPSVVLPTTAEDEHLGQEPPSVLGDVSKRNFTSSWFEPGSGDEAAEHGQGGKVLPRNKIQDLA